MEPVVLALAGSAVPRRDTADWAAHEARLRGVPLRVRSGPLPAMFPATMVVCEVRRTDAVPPFFGAPPAEVPAPVVLVPESVGPSRHRPDVTVGVDARDPAPAALRFAFDSARFRGGRLRAVHAWRLPPEAALLPFGLPETDRATWEDQEVQLLADVLRPWRARYPEVQVLEDVRLFAPAEALLHCSTNAALTVIGRPSCGVGREMSTGSLLAATTCPVAVVAS
ncbi:universal stress protein [Streptomyces fuscichromogenes]|uniref:universal stress protein n=1 Tax=Streptomyces fuscichromogenes TaxID=1324013 RepID=UPI003808F75B